MPSSPRQPLPSTLEVPGSGDVFDNGENLPISRSTESGFSDFVQYQEDGSEETERTPQPAYKTDGRLTTGPCPTKTLEKPVMQCCLEHFQQFLSRHITLYILPGQVDRGEGQRGELMPSDKSQLRDPLELCSESETIQRERECVAAFTAACQLFLECSSFPIYIAEGNLKSSPTLEELFSKSQNKLSTFLFFKYS